MPKLSYKNYLLAALTVISIFNTVDRVALGVLLQDIKVDLNLSDTQLGMIGGIAFALFYSIMGVPIARLADRGNRVTIISVTAALWGGAVALCGAATSFFQLILFRMFVGVGEAGCLPPAFSLISDYFDRAERPRAIAIFGMGAPLGAVVGFLLAGWLGEQYGWRMTFVLLGLPSAALAALAYFTLLEPRRAAGRAGMTIPTAVQPSMMEVARVMVRSRAFTYLLIGFAVMAFFSQGIFVWLPAFIIRSHGLAMSEVGTWLAFTWGLSGAAGAFFGGAVADRYAVNNERLQLRLLAFAIGAGGLLSTFAYFASSHVTAFMLIGASTFGLAATNGPLFAAFQTLMPERMRAVSIALAYLVANLVGTGLGPIAAGAMSDLLRPWAGEESLRYALIALSPGYLIVAWCIWRASTSILRDVERVQDGSVSVANPA